MMEQGRSFSGRERNCCFLNVGGERFAIASAVSGLDFPDDGRAVAVVDWDQDGDLDLWVSNRNAPRLRFMRNDTSDENHSLVLQLVGNGTTCNRDAIGARVEVISAGLGENRLIRTLRAGEGLMSQSSKLVHFGLGELDHVEEVVVHWPGGEVETFDGFEVDGRYQLRQGTAKNGQADKIDAPVRKLAIEPGQQPSEKSFTSMRVPMIALLPMPREVPYIDLEGVRRKMQFGRSNKLTLIVLWASWCAPCHKELADLVSHESELRAAGIDVVALTVDGLSDDGTKPDAAKTLCDQLNVKFSTGKAAPEFVQLMTGYHHMLVAMKKLLPVPTSFLVDRHGRLTMIYKGPLDVEELLEDARFEPESLVDRSRRAAIFPGRMIDDDGLMRPLRRTEANALCAMGKAFASGRRFVDAIPMFRSALETEPDFGEAHLGLAHALESTNQLAESAIEYQQTMKYFPDRDVLHFRLGHVWVRQAKLQNAYSSYSEAIRLNPGHWEAMVSRANVLMRLNRQKEAVEDFRQALKLNPNCVPAQQALRMIESRKCP